MATRRGGCGTWGSVRLSRPAAEALVKRQSNDMVHAGARPGRGAMVARLGAIADGLSEDPVGQIRAIVQLAATRISDPAYRGWPMSNAEVEIADRGHPARRVCEQYKVKVRTHLHDLAGQVFFSELG
jgi:hypothetical protein